MQHPCRLFYHIFEWTTYLSEPHIWWTKYLVNQIFEWTTYLSEPHIWVNQWILLFRYELMVRVNEKMNKWLYGHQNYPFAEKGEFLEIIYCIAISRSTVFHIYFYFSIREIAVINYVKCIFIGPINNPMFVFNLQFWWVNSSALRRPATCFDPMGIADWGDILFHIYTYIVLV